jgi:DNA-directed RNA polymerase subunit L
MNPHIEKIVEDNGVLTFTLNGVNVSLANAIRRTILSDIKTVVFRTSPYEENKSNILVNTTRFNNEIIKQRLSCIPIHINDLETPLENYIMEVNVENTTDTIMYVTTEDFKIKNKTTDQYLSEKDVHNIFPPNELTGYYIDFVRLRPKISDEILGEKIHLTCEFSVDSAKTDGSFNVISTCSYQYTVDNDQMESELDKKKQQWKDKGLGKDEIMFESENWKLLEGKRIVKKDSFDFVIQTIGVFENRELVKKACTILISKLEKLDTIIDTDDIEINPSDNTMKNSFDIILKNEDYTIGKVLEFILYAKFFENLKTLSYCGFKKMHPHDTDSIIRVAFKETTEKSTVKQNLKSCLNDAVTIYKNITKKF